MDFARRSSRSFPVVRESRSSRWPCRALPPRPSAFSSAPLLAGYSRESYLPVSSYLSRSFRVAFRAGIKRTTSPSTSSRTVCAISRTSPPVPPLASAIHPVRRFGPAGRGRLTPCFCPFLRALTGSHTTEMSLQKCKSKYGTTRDWPSLARGRKTNVAGIASAICNITR